MPVNVTIRAVPDDVRDILAARAAALHMSLQEYLSTELTFLASRPSPAEAIATARRRAATYPPVTAGDILDDLGTDRR